MPETFPRRPPRLDRVFTTPVYFVTFCTHRRRPLLDHAFIHEAFVIFATRALTSRSIIVGRYVLMPDHVHFFVAGDQGFDLASWIKSLKQTLGKALSPEARKRTRTWQEGFFDHVLRNDESMAQKWEYIRQNPVRAGLVPRPEDWPFQGEIARIDRV